MNGKRSASKHSKSKTFARICLGKIFNLSSTHDFKLFAIHNSTNLILKQQIPNLPASFVMCIRISIWVEKRISSKNIKLKFQSNGNGRSVDTHFTQFFFINLLIFARHTAALDTFKLDYIDISCSLKIIPCFQVHAVNVIVLFFSDFSSWTSTFHNDHFDNSSYIKYC